MTTTKTLLQHAGSEHRLGRGLIGAQEVAITFATPSLNNTPVYSRLGNTVNHQELENLLAALHETDDAIATGSGMSSFTLMFMTLAKPGDHILCQDGCYGGTYNFLTKILGPWGVETTFAPLKDWSKHLKPNTRFVMAESISNPFCLPLDLQAVAQFAKNHNLISICDNTFAGPTLCKPMKHGFDLVMESATKYMNGHSDVIAGMLAGKSALLEPLRAPHAYLGTFLPTPQCVQLMRGLRTLDVRMSAHTKHGKYFSEGMRVIDDVSEVHYGCAKDAPPFACFTEGFGGMVAVKFKKNVVMSSFMKSLNLITDVPSLGGTESTATLPTYTTNWFMTEAQKSAWGIDEHLVRFSIGLEDPEDLLSDIRQALQSAK